MHTETYPWLDLGRLDRARLRAWAWPLLRGNARLRRLLQRPFGELVVRQAQPAPRAHQPHWHRRGYHERSHVLPVASRPYQRRTPPHAAAHLRATRVLAALSAVAIQLGAYSAL
eukprot:scaffold50214_cov65-Phaeocystis_antarctica.AAC.2